MVPAQESVADAALIDATLAALRDERRRAPADLVAILTLLLLLAAVLLLAMGIALGEGAARDLCLNLTSEVLGVALTVGIIGGLWQQLQTSSEGALEGLVERTAQRRIRPLSDPERAAFGAIVDLHRQTARRGFLPRLTYGFLFAIRNRRRLRALEDMLTGREKAVPVQSNGPSVDDGIEPDPPVRD
jgi:uncharacterized membrane protein